MIKKQPISEAFSNYLASNLKLVTYKNKSVLVFKVESQVEPVIYDEKYYDREACNTVEVPTVRIGELYKIFEVEKFIFNSVFVQLSGKY